MNSYFRKYFCNEDNIRLKDTVVYVNVILIEECGRDDLEI